MRIQHIILWFALASVALLPGCASNGSRNMETVVTDMHQRVTLLEEGLEPSLASLNEKAAALIQRVNENERQVRVLTSLIEENQHKLDNLLKMLSDLRATLYRHWGLSLGPSTTPSKSRNSGIEIIPPQRTEAERPSEDRIASPAAAPPLKQAGPGSAEAYAAAKVLYDQEDFSGAESAFEGFLKAYPRSEQAHMARFWLGKCFLNMSQYSRAIKEFEALRRDYPDSAYIAFALHNQAVSHYQLGERNTAIALMEAVVENYPTTTAADDARRDLQQLRGR